MFKRIRHRKALSFVSLVLALAMLLSMNVFAASYSPGTRLLESVNQYMMVSSTLTYSSNTASAINVTQLANYVTNSGYYEVDSIAYKVYTGDQSKTTEFSGVSPLKLATGKSGRIEVDWLTMCRAKGYTDTIFIKSKAGNSDNYVYVDICAGSQYGLIGGWEIFCYPSSFDPYFHA